jgi:hypothetical protein
MAYRVLIQAGHNRPLEPGFETGTGTYMEAEFTAALQKSLLALFAKDARFAAIPVPGDIPNGINCDAALFLHGDGSVNQSASGYCFGYPEYTVNRRLAGLIGEEFEKIPGHPPHRQDNYTGGLRGYYGYSRVDTPGPEVLVEHGFLTNPAERLWLFANISKLAGAEYVAVCRYFRVTPAGDVQNRKRLQALRAWILKRKNEGWSWQRIKATANWREYLRRGGK